MTIKTWLRRALMPMATGLVALACTQSKNLPGAGDHGAPIAAEKVDLSCSYGASRECTITLAEHAGTLSCFRGSQYCEANGTWGACTNGSASSLTVDTELLARWRLSAVAGAGECSTNPCDPKCRAFEQPPDAGVDNGGTLDLSSAFQWQVGSLSDFPPGLVNKGLTEPCTTGFDCQFNRYCDDVVTESCSHDKCEAGEGLEASCDPCVTEVCAIAPNCCEQGSTACTHSECSTGAALKTTCSSCTATVCAQKSECCSAASSWDASCVAIAEAECSGTCSSGGGDGAGDCCADGEIYDGRCYKSLDGSSREWDEAREDCQALGSGWDLASISDDDENDFVESIASSSAWIGFHAEPQGRWLSWSWTNDDPSGNWIDGLGGSLWENFRSGEPDDGERCAQLRHDGTWRGRDCDDDGGAVCEGPLQCGGGSSSGGAASCDHDPCHQGAALDSQCDLCVQAVCAADPSCCSGSWGSECVALVASECTAQCECDAGQSAHDGSCYKFNSDTRSWESSRSECQSGGGELVSISDEDENDFVAGLTNVYDTWIGLNDLDENRTWRWNNGDPGGTWSEYGRGGFWQKFRYDEPNRNEDCARIRGDKLWYGKECSTRYASICEYQPALSFLTPVPSMGDGAGGASGAGGAGAGGAPSTPPPAPGWNESCAAMVESVCDAQCASGGETPAGECSQWYPGMQDSACSGIDLALDVPCDGSIPVCNHGTQEAPAGIRLVHFPGNSNQYPLCSPDQTHPQMYECFTDRPIPAGQCINVDNCPKLVGNREIMVNPPGAAHVAECSCKDNWTLFSGGSSCREPTCSGGSNAATLKSRPVDVIIGIDNSGSMAGEIEAVQERINRDFAEIIQASGIDYRVIMLSRYGNVYDAYQDGGEGYDSAYGICVGSPLSQLSCPTSKYRSTPRVAHNEPYFYHYSTDIGSRDMFCKITDTLNRADPYPNRRSNWNAVAPNGWLEFLREDSLKVFVAITDDAADTNSSGSSGRCKSSTGFTDNSTGAEAFDRQLRTLAPEHFGPYDPSDPNKDRNYIWYSIVGMAGNHRSNPTPLTPDTPIETRCCKGNGEARSCPSSGAPSSDAQAAGVAYQHLSRMTGGLRYPICYNKNFDDIFNAIAQGVIEGAQLACNFGVDNAENIDLDSAQLIFREDGNAAAEELMQVASSDQCNSNGWYRTTSDTSDEVVLCPSACARVQAAPEGRLDLEIGCAQTAGYEPYTIEEEYQALCANDEVSQWGFLSVAVDTPGDSSVAIRARTAETEAGLAAATYLDVATLSALNGNSYCVSPAVPGCPIDLHATLGGQPLVGYPFIQLEATVTPTSDATQLPTVQTWNMTYSCPFAQ